MGRRGRKRQLEVEARYWQLLGSGVGTVEACRQVGITRKTGYRWRAEVGGVALVRLAEAVRSNRYLSLLDRQRIAALHRQGVGVREIARRLDRAASTISRELRRNTAAHDKGDYDAPLAHARARARGARPGRSRLAKDPALRAVVQAKLELEWSPEQIAAHLRTAYPGTPAWHLCHETIYQALYRGARGGLHRRLTKRLRTGRPLRKRRRRPDQRRSRYVVPHQRIEHRPAIVAERSRVGDWEGDLVVGPMSRSAVATLVDRRSRYLRLVHLPNGHRSEHLLAALRTALDTMPAGKRASCATSTFTGRARARDRDRQDVPSRRCSGGRHGHGVLSLGPTMETKARRITRNGPMNADARRTDGRPRHRSGHEPVVIRSVVNYLSAWSMAAGLLALQVAIDSMHLYSTWPDAPDETPVQALKLYSVFAVIGIGAFVLFARPRLEIWQGRVILRNFVRDAHIDADAIAAVDGTGKYLRVRAQDGRWFTAYGTEAANLTVMRGRQQAATRLEQALGRTLPRETEVVDLTRPAPVAGHGDRVRVTWRGRPSVPELGLVAAWVAYPAAAIMRDLLS